MKILLDVMGGDHCPTEAIKGAVTALKKIESDIVLIGKEELIKEEIKKIYGKEDIKQISERLSIINADEVVENTDVPLQAIKKKKNSSMVKGFELIKNGEVDAFVSSGNTGALMAGATLCVGRIKGIDRPALTAIMPAYNGSFMVLDAGANTNCKPINFKQFAYMGSIYMNKVRNVEKPRVALLNIGAEETKGTELIKETYQTLKQDEKINFVGNVEGRYIFDGSVDVVVTDGFNGNIAIKTTEGVGLMVNKMLKEELYRNLYTKFMAFLLYPALKRFKKRMDYTEYGGGILLGIEKPIIKCHGGAKEKLFVTTLMQAENYAKSGAIEEIKKEIENNL
ncbi:MAG: phosphate acyltransferase PlsX [Clostridiales bacterium]|nr:phosphate acyltransferase PlsX [Clostridiales bacterium]